MEGLTTPMIAAIISVFLGALMRTFAPAIRKMKEEGETFAWNQKYTFTLVISCLISGIVTMILFLTFEIPDRVLIYVIFGGFVEGFGSNALINEVGKIFGFFKEQEPSD